MERPNLPVGSQAQCQVYGKYSDMLTSLPEYDGPENGYTIEASVLVDEQGTYQPPTARFLPLAKDTSQGDQQDAVMDAIRVEKGMLVLAGKGHQLLSVQFPVPNLHGLDAHNKIKDIRLFRQSSTPEFRWTDRSLDKDIPLWRTSPKTTKLTQYVGSSSVEVTVRLFDPLPGDVLDYTWNTSLGQQRVVCAPYAIECMDLALEGIEGHIRAHAGQYVKAFTGTRLPIVRATFEIIDYTIEHKQQSHAERILLYDVLLFWVASRLLEEPWCASGDESLGHNPTEDHPLLSPECPFNGRTPVSPVMDAQIDQLVMKSVLAPLCLRIQEKLQALVNDGAKGKWFTAFLCIFVLLSNYDLATAHDHDFAVRNSLEEYYSNYPLLEGFQAGAKTLLAYFHHQCHGHVPFKLDWSDPSVIATANLDHAQAEYMEEMGLWVTEKETALKALKESKAYDAESYFALQLFDSDWRPTRTMQIEEVYFIYDSRTADTKVVAFRTKKKMKQWISTQDGLDNLKLVDVPEPSDPKDGEVLVKTSRVSLNFRDTEVCMGVYGHHKSLKPGKNEIVPCSDMCGTVTKVGSGNSSGLREGDRVVSIFNQTHLTGQIVEQDMASGLGLPLPGVLTQYRVFPAASLVKVPAYMADDEAAALPIAAVTAWMSINTFQPMGQPLTGKDKVVLVQGTGGVSISGLQIAKALGMTGESLHNSSKIIVTSSSDKKLEQARTLGADHTINYKTTPNWDDRVLEVTGGRGADIVFECGGAQTLNRSFECVRFGGQISCIGYLSGKQDTPAGSGLHTNVLALKRNVTVKGMINGPKDRFEEMLGLYEEKEIHPVIDRVFDFEEGGEALKYLFSGEHFGKVIVKVP
ncbi:Uu.00g036010.m01.CDS01 [Anthostomella pinea]|uniref:Uu.00g036010.m01.CDS01 n=1 Tax=Anthostomella pinea TaxID=933095 RepID=A0AAI8YDN0_9PEZI|nr:Uu.00g036010.m01.CDS01 [Anthostomella pinea]